jgi:hypothetical protein
MFHVQVKEMLRHEAMVARRKKEADDKLRTGSTKIAMPEELPQQANLFTVTTYLLLVLTELCFQ